MTPPVPTFGLWSETDAVLWPERTHAPTYLTGAAHAVWAAVALHGRDPHGPDVGLDGAAVDRVLAGLDARGLLTPDPPPVLPALLPGEAVLHLDGVAVAVAASPTELEGWAHTPAPEGEVPLLRLQRTEASRWSVADAANGLPILDADRPGAEAALVAAGTALAHPAPDRLRIGLERWRRDDQVVLVSPVLVAEGAEREACRATGATPAGSPVTELVGIDLRSDDRPVTGFVLDQAWAAANPEGGPLALHWLLACLLAVANPVRTTGRYALLDAAARLAPGRIVAWAGRDEPGRVSELLERLPVAAP